MDFLQHQSGCEKCKLVDTSKPTTLSNCCFIGAPLLREHLVNMVKPEIVKQNRRLKSQFVRQQSDGKSYKTTAKKLKEVMRYK